MTGQEQELPVVRKLRGRCCVNAYGQGTAFRDPLSAEAAELMTALARKLETALRVLDAANVAWGGEPEARALIKKAVGE